MSDFRCFVTNILKTPEERREDIARRLRGEAPIPPEQSKNYVGDTPNQFKAWCVLNAGRVERAKSVPYFIRDNQGYYDAALNPKKTEELTPLEIAKCRHEQRTPEQAQAIRDRWQRSRIKANFSSEIRLDYIGNMKGDLIGVMRIDDKLINPEFSSRFVKAR